MGPVDTQAVDSREALLWRAWRERGDESARDGLIALHLDFARIIAAKLYGRRVTDEVEFDEYLQFARIGLLESMERYDPAQGAAFRSFAGHRMQGAVLSGLEGLSESRRQIALRRRLESERARSLAAPDEATPSDAFEHLVSVAVGLAVGYMLDDVAIYQAGEGGGVDSGYHALAQRQMRQRLNALIMQLPPREQRIVRHHYLQQIPFDAIARELGCTPGRVSQLHKQALLRLREWLRSERLDLRL